MTRASADEHRIAACVANPLVFNIELIAPLIFKHVLPGSDPGRKRWPALLQIAFGSVQTSRIDSDTVNSRGTPH
jgi:hypothetical protein